MAAPKRMIEQINSNFSSAQTDEIATIFAESIQKLNEIEQKMRLSKSLSERPTKIEIVDLKKAIKEGDKKSSQVIANLQRNLRLSLASQDKMIKLDYLSRLHEEGVGAMFVHLLAFLGSKEAKKAVKSFEEAEKRMGELNKPSGDFKLLSKADQKKLEVLKNPEKLEKKAGVLLIGRVSILPVSFKEKEIAKQLTSFRAQALSNAERRPFAKTIAFTDSFSIEQSFCPLNQFFDEKHEGSFFGSIFGEKGLSSMDSAGRNHLVNGFEVELKDENGSTLFRSLRHGVTSDKEASIGSKIREIHSRRAAKELAVAALLQELEERGLTL